MGRQGEDKMGRGKEGGDRIWVVVGKRGLCYGDELIYDTINYRHILFDRCILVLTN